MRGAADSSMTSVLGLDKGGQGFCDVECWEHWWGGAEAA